MVLENENALKAEDVADILKIGRNAVYDMAKRGEIRSYRIGRKLRFTYSDIQDYIKSSSSGGTAPAPESPIAQASRASAQFTICGHDILVDTLVDLLCQSNQQAVRVGMNSYDALHALYKDQVDAACCHLIDGATGEYNKSFIKHLVPGCSCVSIRLAARTQGLVVQGGNPKNIQSWEDLDREDVRLANRESGSGVRALLDHKLQSLNIPTNAVSGYDIEFSSELAACTAVAQGMADVSVGRAQSAAQFGGLDFIPLQEEHYDLVMKEKALRRPEAKALLSLLANGKLQRVFACANGYDMHETGRHTIISA